MGVRGPASGGKGAGERPPLQFRLRTLFGVAVGVGLLFGLVRWLDVPPRTGFVLLAVVVVSVACAVGLLVAIAGVWPREDGWADDGEKRRSR